MNDPQAGAPLESTKVPLRAQRVSHAHFLVREGGHVYSLARATRRVPGRQGKGPPGQNARVKDRQNTVKCFMELKQLKFVNLELKEDQQNMKASLKKAVRAIIPAALGLAALTTPAMAQSQYSWPSYSPTLNYDWTADYGNLAAPTQVLNDCANVSGTVTSGWWCFRYGPSKNSLVTSASWNPLLAKLNTDFAYFRNTMHWPPDKRAKRGYYSSVYLYGSGLCTDSAPNTALGGWQGNINYNGEDWPMVLLSYYPVYCFDPACTYSDRLAQQGDCTHEGIHSVLADLGCKQACWFQEGGNTWLQGTATSLQTGDFSSMGFLSAGSMIAPFMPIECYSGWLQDNSFGGPCAEGVDHGAGVCSWRNLLGGVQYSESFPHFMGEIVSPGSVAWIWRYCQGRVLEGLATASGGLGATQTRHLVQEYRARQAMCDFGKWSNAYVGLLNNNWGVTIDQEFSPYWIDCAAWTASCYANTTNSSGTLTPEARTLPGWSGANQIPLTVNGTAGNTVSVTFNPIGANMSCQLVYRATDNSIVYSSPVSSGTCGITLPKAVKNNVVVAVVCNTDYVYVNDTTRTTHYDYRIVLGTNVTGTASVSSKWFDPATGGVGAPAPPINLAAAAGNGQVALTWAATPGATSYNIYRGTTAGGESATAIASTNISTTSYTNTGLTNGTTYYYKVKAVNSNGTSAYSNEASAAPTGATSIPAAPTNLVATAGNAQISLTWTASSGATSYSVYRGTTANGESATPLVSGLTTTSYTNSGLTNGTHYYYKVKATNSAGTSGYSGEASATPAATVFAAWNKIVCQANSLALDNYNVTTSGTAIHQETYSASALAEQGWSFTASGSYYIIKNKQSGLALQPASTSAGAVINEVTANGSTSQNWAVTALGGGLYKIINQASGLALDNHLLSNGGQLYQESYSGPVQQQWLIASQ